MSTPLCNIRVLLRKTHGAMPDSHRQFTSWTIVHQHTLTCSHSSHMIVLVSSPTKMRSTKFILTPSFPYASGKETHSFHTYLLYIRIYYIMNSNSTRHYISNKCWELSVSIKSLGLKSADAELSLYHSFCHKSNTLICLLSYYAAWQVT